MKKYIILSVLFTLFGLVSCYDDDSSLGTKNIGDITIGTLEDASIISYSGNKLIREPEIETTYPDDQLTYAWYIYKEDQDKGFRTNKIDSVKNHVFAGILYLERDGRREHGTGRVHAERASLRSFSLDTRGSLIRFSS